MDWQAVLQYLLDAQFLYPLIAGVVGACAGSWVSHVAVTRKQDEDLARSEIAAINVCLSLSLSIFNSLSSYKVHVLRDTLDLYDKNLESYKSGGREFEFDLTTPPAFHVSTEHLQSVLIDRANPPYSVLVVAVELGNRINYLMSVIEVRVQLCEEWRTNPPQGDERSLAMYFGVLHSGHTDTRIKDNIYSTRQAIDDAVYFSKMLSDELSTYGARVRWNNRRFKLPPVRKVDWLTIADGVIPSSDNYKSWQPSVMLIEPGIIGAIRRWNSHRRR